MHEPEAAHDEGGIGNNLARFCERHERASLVCGLALAVISRSMVALSPYSGESTPPMYGDYEAQRHWMEITTALPMTEWYENSTRNDLLYWGLDYPPLTAYHSLVLGAAGHRLVPECFHLYSSRGHESSGCRSFMRGSVIISDLLVYFPGVFYAVSGFAAEQERSAVRIFTVLLLWNLPPLVLIDHGHFQYNGVCFGLCLAGAGFVARGRILIASVLFTSGLLFKQIALYYAPAFFFGILALHFHRSNRFISAIQHVLLTGLVVFGTVAVIFLPWLCATSPLAAAGQVLHRMFPFARGLYEDKVANVWCSISIIIKLHRLFSPKYVPMVCAMVTLLALLPGCAYCLCTRCNHRATFAAALICSSMAFFLFAFQVHEKSILFPCVAACLLPIAVGPGKRPSWTGAALCHLMLACTFSMYPLVVKDKLTTAYIAACVSLVLACEAFPSPRLLRAVFHSCYFVGLLLHAIHALAPRPQRYPDAWTLLITGFSCGYFVFILLVVSGAQLCGAIDGIPRDGRKSVKSD